MISLIIVLPEQRCRGLCLVQDQIFLKQTYNERIVGNHFALQDLFSLEASNPMHSMI